MRIKEFYCPNCQEFRSLRQTVYDRRYRRFCSQCNEPVQETKMLFKKLSDLLLADPEAVGLFDATKDKERYPWALSDEG